MSGSNATPKLNHCGCCAGEASLTAVTNRPGLPALSYRIGTYGLFLERLLGGIHAQRIPDGPNAGTLPLAQLTTRALDDPSIGLLDAWSVVGDVLTFYQERIANEGYLRTATERRSVLELARTIGYELSPGVAASAYLAFTVEEIIGAAASAGAPGARAQSAPGPGNAAFNSGVVDIPQTTQAQSVPAPGQLPQTFETAADLQVRVEWNAMKPRLQRTQDLALYNGQLYLLGVSAGFQSWWVDMLPASQLFLLNPLTVLDPSMVLVPALPVQQIFLQGTDSKLKSGDRLLLVGSKNSTVRTKSFLIRSVQPNAGENITRIDFAENFWQPAFQPATFTPAVLTLGKIPFTQADVETQILQKSISEGDLNAFLRMNEWSARDLATLVNSPPVVPVAQNGAFAFRGTAAFFGHNAPLWKSLTKPGTVLRADPYPLDWDAANDGSGRSIWTDSQGNAYADANVFLERSFPQILADSWTLLDSPSAGLTAAYQVRAVTERSLADYTLSGKATGLTLESHANSGAGLASPSVVSWSANRLDVFALGIDGDLYHKWWDGSNWGGPENLGGGNLVNSPSAASWSAGRLDIFAIGSDGNLYHKWWDGAWGGPENLGGGILVNSPSAVCWSAGRLDIFAIGSNGNLYHKWWQGSWGNWDDLGGGNLVNSPSAVSWSVGRLDIFAVGSDGYLYHKWWDGSNWGGVENLGGGNLVNSPSAVSWSANRLDIFAVDTGGYLRHLGWDGSNWGGIEYLGGGNLVNSPSAVSWSANRLDIFALGSDGNWYHDWWNGSYWGWLENLGGDGNLTTAPVAAAWSANRLDVFAIGSGEHWMHEAWDGSNWYGPEDLGNGMLAPFAVRKTTAFVQSEQLALAQLPIRDDIAAGTTSLMLNNMVLGLKPGGFVVLTGVRADASGVASNEVLTLLEIVHVAGFTVLEFESGLRYSYLRSSVSINANVALATHGATVQEVLGNGDASQANRSFQLKRPPLTYVSAATASGVASTLTVRVNDLEWTEASTLYGLTAKDEKYIVRLADDGTPMLTFGEPAARLRSGQQNVRAEYRTGIGLAGNVGAGSLSMLMSRPPGLRGVTNPLPATGGADPQNLQDSRVNAPLTVLTLDRIVSLDDYESFARAFAGIGKAQAVALWSGETHLVHITVAAANGDSIDPSWPLYSTLIHAIQLACDPVQHALVAGYQSLLFNLKASILIDKPRYEPSIVMQQVTAALQAAFAFRNRAFAQAVSAAEVLTRIQSVPGVIATDLSQLYMTSDPGGPAQTEPAPFLLASPARWEGGAIQPAQLLLLNPLGVALSEITS